MFRSPHAFQGNRWAAPPVLPPAAFLDAWSPWPPRAAATTGTCLTMDSPNTSFRLG